MTSNRSTNSSSIYMANLEYGMDEHVVRKLFEDQGEKVVYVRVIRKTRPEGSSYAYCFVDFGNKEIATRVLRQYNNKPIPGMANKRFRLNHCQRGDTQSSQSRPEFSIFVGDLTPDIDDLMLHDFVVELGYADVKAAKVVCDEQGVSKGFGFVRFYNEEERNKAAVEMQGLVGLGGKALKISVATPKSRAFEFGEKQQPNSSTGSYYGGTNFAQYNGPWNHQWQHPEGGDYNSQYFQAGGGNEWSDMNYEQYYGYQDQSQDQSQDISDQNASVEESKKETPAPSAIDDDALDNMEHGQEPTDMTSIDKGIKKHCSGEFYQAMQRSRWHPVSTFAYNVEGKLP